MKRFLLLISVLMCSMLLLFFVIQAFNLPFLQGAGFMLQQQKWLAACTGIVLLVVDVVAPVPSSMIMFVNGFLFGSFWGTGLSLIGGLGAAFCGYWIGKKGRYAGMRFIGADGMNQANNFFSKWGALSVIASRPIPIMAEAVSIAAGMAGMKPGKLLLASIAGLLPAVLLYAVAGAWSLDIDSGLWAFGIVLVLAGATWFIGKRQTG